MGRVDNQSVGGEGLALHEQNCLPHRHKQHSTACHAH